MAMSLSGMLILGAFGVLNAMNRSDRILAARFRDTTTLLRTHETLRYAMQSLLFAPNEDNAQNAPPNDQNGAVGETGVNGNNETVEIDGRQITQVSPGEDNPFENIRFELKTYDAAEAKHVLPTLDLDLSPQELGSVLKYIKVALSRSPIANLPSNFWGVWGAFEAVPSGGAWTLMWTPIDPPGKPVVLVNDAVLVLAMALGQGNKWVSDMQATQRKDMPRAIRLILWTRNGAKIDWLFEPGVTLGQTQ